MWKKNRWSLCPPLPEGYFPTSSCLLSCTHTYVHYLQALNCSSTTWPLASVVPSPPWQLQVCAYNDFCIYTPTSSKKIYVHELRVIIAFKLAEHFYSTWCQYGEAYSKTYYVCRREHVYCNVAAAPSCT